MITIILNDKILGKIMNYVYAIFLIYSSFLGYKNDDSDNMDKFKIFAYMIMYNPLHVFLSLINRILAIIVLSILYYIKFFIQIDN